MTRLINRIAGADGSLARAADRLARGLLPKLSASGYCYARCTGQSCYSTFYSKPGLIRCQYCTEGYWSGPCFCSPSCLGI